MKTFLIASTALSALLVLPALAGLGDAGGPTGAYVGARGAAASASGEEPLPLIRVADDDGHGEARTQRRGHDDEDDDDDCEDDDDDGCSGAGGKANPAPTGSVAPPANGLFGKGAPAAVTR